MFKTRKDIIVIQAEETEPNRTGVVFWSHDKGTAKMIFELQKNHVDQSLATGTKVPILLEFDSATAENGRGKHTYFATIDDAVNGIVSIILEDNILGYQGRVDGSIYIELPDSRSLDTAGRFTFHIKRSPIDEDVPELEDYYWQGFGEIMEQYHESIAEIKSEAKALLDSLTADVTTAKTKVTQLEQSITTANTNLNSRIDEINKKIDDHDVFTKAESSANVINQIGGAESAILKKELLVDGTEGTGARDENGTLTPFSDEDYHKLMSIDDVVKSETLMENRGAEIEFTFDVIGTLTKKYAYLFSKSSTLADKIDKFKAIQKSITCSCTLAASGKKSDDIQVQSFRALNYIKASATSFWALGNHNSNSFGTVKREFSEAHLGCMTNDGKFIIYAASKKNGSNDWGGVSDGVTPARVEVKDIRLTIELEVNGRTVIESMIAQNHVTNLATQAEATTATDNTKTMTPLRTKQLLDAKLLNMVYPIGSIYMSVNSATPATLFGGTWERFAKGQVLVGVDESDPVLVTAEMQGGSTNGLTEHTHATELTTYRVLSNAGSGTVNNLARATDNGNAQTGTIGKTTKAGDNTDHKNWQPFNTVYIWKRTA